MGGTDRAEGKGALKNKLVKLVLCQNEFPVIAAACRMQLLSKGFAASSKL
jgi:hypothetical protein